MSKTSSPTRFHALGNIYADYLASIVAFPIALTIQPNFGMTDGAQGRARFKELTGKFFYELDKEYTFCNQPHWLSHHQRIGGFVTLEKVGVSTHGHFLISCSSKGQQESLSTFLLEVADNVTKTRQEPLDELWQRNTREYIRTQPTASQSWSRTRSINKELIATSSRQIVNE